MLPIFSDTILIILSYEKITSDELGAKLDWSFPFYSLPGI